MIKIEIIVCFILSFLSYILGGFDTCLNVLLVVVVIDYITGIAKAISFKKVNSIIGLKGILKKLGYFIIVALDVAIDKIVGSNGAIRVVVIYFFIANEGISILENWGLMGLPLPKKLINILEQLKDGVL